MWRDDPWQDSIDGRWSNVWHLFKQALGCTIWGHRFRVYEPGWEGDTMWRACGRCDRKWTYQPAPPTDDAAREVE